MKKYVKAAILSAFSALALTGCGGGGGGGGPSAVATKLYLFGNMSSNFNVAEVTSSITAPAFADYSAPTRSATGIFPLRSGVLAASGPVHASLASGTFDTVSKKLTISLVNGTFLNMSSSTARNNGKGTEIATLVTSPGTTLPTVDPTPDVGQFRLSPLKTGKLNGCKVNYQ